MFNPKKLTRFFAGMVLLAAAAFPQFAFGAGPAPVNLRSTASFVILSGAGITSTGGGIIKGNVGASPIAGSAIGVTCAQVIGTIYAVDASGPPCAIIDASLLTTAKGDLTTAYIDAAGRTPTPTGPNLNPGLIPGSGNIGGMTLAPGLYKFTTTAMISGADVTLFGGADDVWIFQCAQDLQLASGTKIILAGGAQAKNVFWQVGTSAVLGTSSSFKGTILADQAITLNTSSTLEGRALAFAAGVVFNGSSSSLPTSPEIAVEQPLGADLADGGNKNFGSVVVGGNNTLVFTIKNTGDADLTGLAITIDGVDALSFNVTANPVGPVSGPAGTTTFTVRFAPTTAGAKVAALHIASSDSDENPFDIALTGLGTAAAVPEIEVEQPFGINVADGGSKDFGTVALGGNNSLVFTIQNTGSADLTGLGIIIDGANANQFSITANPTAPVSGPLGSTTFTVQFSPTSPGLKVAALRLASNDSDENPFDIALTGLGTAFPITEIAIEQPLGANLVDGGSKSFGSVGIGANNSLVFTVRNTGSADLTGLGITIDGANANQFSITANPTAPVSGPLGSTTFTVRFAPTSAGLKVAALHVASNDTDENPFDIALSGSGAAVAVAEIAVEQPLGADLVDGGSKSFGSVVTGGNKSLVFTIKNTGNADLTGLGITIDGVDASSFGVTASPTSPVGGPSGGTTFTVRFAPGTAGSKIAALHIASNDADENPFDITLTGTATVGAVPEISVSQPAGLTQTNRASKSFGSVVVGADVSLVFAIKNIGNADLTGLGITIDGADASSFAVTASPTSPVGGPNGGTTFTVRFAPATVGPKTANLHLASNDSDENPFDLILTGTATPVPVPEISVGQPAGINIVDGGARNFGSVVVGGNKTYIFDIRNTGDADLTGLGITLDGVDATSFVVTVNPTAPVGGPAGGTTFSIQFAPFAVGAKTATLHIANNDGDENPFDITLTGVATPIPAPEIVIEQPLGESMADGDVKDFGDVILGNSAPLIFTIKNIGNADLTGLALTIDGANPSSFSIAASPTTPVGGPSGGTTLTVRFAPTTVGLKTAALHIASNDADEDPFDIVLVGNGLPALLITSTSPITLNPQTGLFEQTVVLFNRSSASVAATRLMVLGLPGDVEVRNRTGVSSGSPFVQYNHPFVGGASISLVVEYYRASRIAFASPAFTVEDTSPSVVNPAGSIIAIDRNLQLNTGRFLIEFTSVPGRVYAIQYSSNLQDWVTVIPSVPAPQNRVQWYDDGPPKTESKPTAGSRFYRVIEMP